MIFLIWDCGVQLAQSGRKGENTFILSNTSLLDPLAEKFIKFYEYLNKIDLFYWQSILTVGAFEVDEPWTLAEETMLLDAVEQYGFGNW